MKKKDTITTIEAEVLHSMANKLIARCHVQNQKQYSAELNGICIDLSARSSNYLAISQGRMSSPIYNNDAFEIELEVLNSYDVIIKGFEVPRPRVLSSIYDVEDAGDENAQWNSKSEWIVFVGLLVLTAISFWWVYF